MAFSLGDRKKEFAQFVESDEKLPNRSENINNLMISIAISDCLGYNKDSFVKR